MSIKNKFRNRKFLSVLIIAVALTVCIVGALAFMIPSWTSYKSYYDAAVAEREHKKYLNSLPLELVGITASLGDGVEYYDNGKAAPKADDFEVMAHFTEKGQSRDELLMSDVYSVKAPADFAQNGGTVTITYTWAPEAEEGEEAPEPVVKTAEVPVTLTHVALESLDVTERPYRVYYGDDMEFDAAGMKATAVYNDGSTAELTADDVTADSSGTLAAGTEYVTVAYDDGESEVTADVPITVVPHGEYEDGAIISIGMRDDVYVADGQQLSETPVDVYANYANGNRLLIEDTSKYTVAGNVEEASFMKNCMLTITLTDGSGVACRVPANVRNGIEAEAAERETAAEEKKVQGYTLQNGELVPDEEQSTVLENFREGDKLTFAASSTTYIETALSFRLANPTDGAIDLGDVMSVRINGRWLPIGGTVLASHELSSDDAGKYVFDDVSLPAVALGKGANKIEITFLADTAIAFDRADVSTEFEGVLYSSVAECIVAENGATKNVKVEKFKDWHTVTAGGYQPYPYALGMCASNEYIYVLYNNWNEEDARQSVIVKCDPDTGNILATSAPTDANISEATSGLCAYDGKIIVFYKDGTQGYVDESAFADGCEFKPYDGFAFEGLEDAIIRDVYYNRANNRSAVLVGTTVYIYDGEKKAVTSFNAPSESYNDKTNTLKRMTGDSDYIYLNYTADGNYEPLIRLYDWNGNFVVRTLIPNSVSVMGEDIITDTSGTNTQALAVIGGDLYITVLKFRGSGGAQSMILRTSLPEVNPEKSVSLAVGDYVAACKDAGVDPVFDVAPFDGTPFGTKGQQMTSGGVSDGRYIYISVAGAFIVDDVEARNCTIYKIDSQTFETVAMSGTYDTLIRGTTDSSRLFIKDGKLYAFGADNTVFMFDLETFAANCMPEVAEDLPFGYVTETAGKTLFSAYWNEAARRFAVSTTDNMMYLLTEEGEPIGEPVQLAAKSSLSGDSKYIYTNTTANNREGVTMTLPVTIYDWDGNLLGTASPKGFFPDAPDNKYNIQTVFAHEGDLYATICSWGAVTDSQYLWKISTDYAVFDPAPASMEITNPPTKTEYVIGESFDPMGMNVSVTMNDGSEIQPSDYDISPAKFTATGAQDVTISYTSGTKTVSQTVSVTVRLPGSFVEYAAACEGLDVEETYTATALPNPFTGTQQLTQGGVSDGEYLYVSVNSAGEPRRNTVYKIDPTTGDRIAVSDTYSTEAMNNADNSRMFVKGGKIYAVAANNVIYEFDAETLTRSEADLPFDAVTSQGTIKSVAWNETESKWAVSTTSGSLYILSEDGAIIRSGISLASGSSASIGGDSDYIYSAPATNGTTSIAVEVFDWDGNKLGSITLPVIEELSGSSFNIQAVYPHGDTLILNICTWGLPTPSSYIWQVTFDNSVFAA